MNNDDRKITITTDNGEVKEMLILFTTRLEKYKKDYVFYYDENSEDGNVFVSSYIERKVNEGSDDVEYSLDPVNDEKEWEDLNEVLEQYIEDLSNQECEGCDKESCEGCSTNA